MFDDQSKRYKNQFVPITAVEVDLYKPFVGEHAIEELKWLAEPLQHKLWVNINSTFIGGGVAEMLQSILPFAKGLGIDCKWYVIEGGDDFFTTTKKFHNLLQGVSQPLSMEEIFHSYLDTISENIQNQKIIGDLVVIHDPQPAAMVMSGQIFGHKI